jgi:glycosyltransferase involved in cell wall biosynthesis
MPFLTAAIITFNEQNFIDRCLSSLEGVADEILVVDSFSTDSTEEICKRHKVRFIKHKFEGYVEQKNYALSLVTYPHVLSLDGDEALSEELKKSILKVKNDFNCDGYYFNRLNNYCGKWIRHSRLYPDRHLRLFDSRKGKWQGPNPHDKFKMNNGCKVKKLKGDLYHWNYSSIEEHIKKTDIFSTIGANELFKEGKKAWPYSASFHKFWSFFRSYILCAGFLDGHLGYRSCTITANGSFMKYEKLRRLKIKAKSEKNG